MINAILCTVTVVTGTFMGLCLLTRSVTCHSAVPNQHHEHDKSEVFHKDKVHIKEQLSNTVDVENKTELTDEELSFYYFHLHDRDNNTKLDGLEIMDAVRNAHEDEKLAVPTIIEMENLIDGVLLDHDLNDDGFIDFGEFLRAQTKEAEKAKREGL